MADFGGERHRADLHRVHCRGCDDPAHRLDGEPVSVSAAREVLRGPDALDHIREEGRLVRRYFGTDATA